MRAMTGLAALAAGLLTISSAQARELAQVTRIDANTVELTRDDSTPVAVWLSRDTVIDRGDRLANPQTSARKIRLAVPESTRTYVILLGDNGKSSVVAERSLPLEHASNFRDIGGYVTADGKTVRWGKAFRSAALPFLTDSDYALVAQLHIGTDVDLRSIDEREVDPDTIDDKTQALFVSNDYSMKKLFADMRKGMGENAYSGMEVLLAPQFRSLYRRIMADNGAVIYHCSAGQDRTGIATAMLYDVLGVDRETILKDYHLSTQLRRPQWEMPKLDPKEWPGNALVQFYASMPASQVNTAQPLYTPSGASHLAQFFAYLDKTYGGSEGYMKKVLGFTDADIARLKAVMLR